MAMTYEELLKQIDGDISRNVAAAIRHHVGDEVLTRDSSLGKHKFEYTYDGTRILTKPVLEDGGLTAFGLDKHDRFVKMFWTLPESQFDTCAVTAEFNRNLCTKIFAFDNLEWGEEVIKWFINKLNGEKINWNPSGSIGWDGKNISTLFPPNKVDEDSDFTDPWGLPWGLGYELWSVGGMLSELKTRGIITEYGIFDESEQSRAYRVDVTDCAYEINLIAE